MNRSTAEYIKDGRRAHGELAVSLQLFDEKLQRLEARYGPLPFARLRAELEGAHMYLAAALDAHQSLNRCLTAEPRKVCETPVGNSSL